MFGSNTYLECTSVVAWGTHSMRIYTGDHDGATVAAGPFGMCAVCNKRANNTLLHLNYSLTTGVCLLVGRGC